MANVTDYLVANGLCRALADVEDPDVTGLGVVVSFMISMVFNFFVITMAYVFDWLPESTDSNSIDEAFRQNLRWFFSCSNDHSSPENVTRLKRIQAFEPFVLGMSDQHFIIGVALAIVSMFMTFNNNLSEKFSVCFFQIATRLGYFSCIDIPLCMTISESVTFRFNRHISVKCVKQHFKFIDPDQPWYVSFSYKVVVLLIQRALVLVIVLGYSRRFLELYHKDARADYHYWSRWSLQRLLGELAENKYNNEFTPTMKSLFKELCNSRDDPTVDRWILALDIWAKSISNSFLWGILWLGFYFVFRMGNS
ncbi:hypothetical protein CCHR01_04296 [Colletotrichum chrysophilum]|uniref:Uncharacterized protein n=1 Tax=Colletotrichum chrysophilum TaxID=1836956 RepID=A0AAD9EMN5_9PEZI|nr:hypothetical protein CCHR01_04296 [Colletotrichum chrysophilum]